MPGGGDARPDGDSSLEEDSIHLLGAERIGLVLAASGHLHPWQNREEDGRDRETGKRYGRRDTSLGGIDK
jgi:hypothetical protein